MATPELTADAARGIATAASLLQNGGRLRPDGDGILEVVRHLGSLQLDPTRTVERTHYLVLWSRLGGYDRDELDRVLWRERRLLEHNAFLVPVERLPELRYESGPWIQRWDGVREWIQTNRAFHDSILAQLRDRGPLQSRDLDDSALVEGWRSSGWTHGKNTTRMLEFMAKALEVLVVGREGQERLWDLAERVIPRDAPDYLPSDAEYAERRLEEAMRRFGVADLREIKTRTYWADKRALPRAIDRFVDEGRLIPVSLPRETVRRPTWATPAALEAAESAVASRTTLLSPFDPLIYDRDRTLELFSFQYKLEMYVPKDQRQFGHFTLPLLHDNRLVGRLDAEMDRAARSLMVKRLHWENDPTTRARREADRAIGRLASFLGATEVRQAPPPTTGDRPRRGR
jgi:uncharacterized protein YcaQ